MKWLENRVGQGFIFHVITPAHYILLKILLVKLKIFRPSAYFNLHHNTKKHKQKCKGYKDDILYQNLTSTLVVLMLAIFLAPLSSFPISSGRKVENW